MNSFDWKKNGEDSIKDGLIITAAATRIFFTLKVACIKPPKTSLETYWCNLWRSVSERLCSLQEIDHRVMQQKFYGPLKAIKLTQHQIQIHSRVFITFLISSFVWALLFYFSMVKIPLGLVTLRWATASSRLNT